MKKILFLIPIVSLITLSCQKQMTEVEPGQMDIRFVHPSAVTRATETAFETGDKIGLYVVETPAPLQISGNYVNNLEATYNGSQWTGDSGVKWPSTESICDIYAYYPYFENVTSITANSFSILEDQSAGYGSCDFLWGKAASVAYTTDAIPLQFSHKLSKITLKLVKGADYVGDLPSSAVFYVHSTVPDATVDLTTGSVTKDPYGTARTITCHKVDDETYEAVVVPQRLSSRTPLFEMVANGVSYLVEGSFNFKPGMNHTFNVTLNTSTESIRIEIGGEIADWN
ncbi:MAG: fimbrillin family protein [Bacteroidales bacterium]|nr:fimbrillin family protein [Bacteroidales bacterium]